MKNKKCKYCDEWFLDNKPDSNTYIDISFNNKIINVYFSWKDTNDRYNRETEIEIKINYCPMCGRKL